MKKYFLFPLITAVVLSNAALAQPEQAAIAEVQALLESGELDKALAAADGFIDDHPEDPRMRFLKGLIFTSQSKWDDAIVVFRTLADDYPQLPAPLNNLAVVYAETGDYESARNVLIEAIKLDPDYAAAHENLGDIYVTLAAEAYQRGASKGSGKRTAAAKLRVLEQLLPDSDPGAAQVEAATEAGPGPASADIAAADSPATAGDSDAVVATAGGGAQTEIGNFVREWAAAWSAQDVDRYLGFYDPNFLPADGKTLQQWRAERRVRLSAPEYIRVSVQNIQPLRSEIDRATANFVQHYESNRYRSTALKELALQRRGNEWKIVRESVRREE